MDKYENKVKIEEIKTLISRGEYDRAADVADTVNWTTIKNIPTLGMASDLYKKLHLFEESRNILLIAYERQPSRPVVKSLCELSIELGDLLNAIKFLNEFRAIAPKDPGNYILQYKIYKAQNINIEEQIEVLEQLKEVQHSAKWSYELAELYHKSGNETKCIEECENIILWFVDGKYVLKAYELKAIHQPLTEQENYRYEVLRQAGGELNIQASLKEKNEAPKKPQKFEVGQDLGVCNTQNLQAVVAEGLQDVFNEGPSQANYEEKPAPASLEEAVAMDEEALNISAPEVGSMTSPDLQITQMINPVIPETPVGQELELSDTSQNIGVEGNYSDTDIIGEAANAMAADMLNEKAANIDATVKEEPEYQLNTDTDEIKPITGPIPQVEEIKAVEIDSNENVSEIPKTNYFVPNSLSNTGIIERFNTVTNMDDMLSQGYDGQISFVVPEEKPVERQITGQISIGDVMKEWEEKKKATEKKLVNDIKKKVEQQTAALLAGFDDEATRNSLLAQIESAIVNAALEQEKEKIAAARPKEIKVADIEALDHTGDIATKIIEEALREDEERAKKAAEEKEALERASKEKAREAAIEKAKEEAALKATEEVKEEAENPDDGIEEIEEVEETQDVAEEIEESANDEDVLEESEEDSFEEIEEVEEKEEEPLVEETKENVVKETAKKPVKENVRKPRQLTDAEKNMFQAFVHHRSTQKQLAEVLDNVTLASYTGNILVSSDDNEVTTFSKLLIQDIQLSDSNFTGKVAMISGDNLNGKEVSEVLDKVKNGALIITSPENLNKKTIDSIARELEKDGLGIVVIIQGHSDDLDALIDENDGLKDIFNLRIDLRAFDDRTLVEYAKSYAYDNEYAIDELGVLALHTRIADMQTSDHEVTMSEIEELVDEAIYYADKKTMGHFFDILFGKRYDVEDMIILREKDFMHY
ncbi:MAG: hypothetical protein MJZ11_07020 [Lachnospiraceae bacterium]|nr:hypothetical protein [Lachnospiraceae bacterium]